MRSAALVVLAAACGRIGFADLPGVWTSDDDGGPPNEAGGHVRDDAGGTTTASCSTRTITQESISTGTVSISGMLGATGGATGSCGGGAGDDIYEITVAGTASLMLEANLSGTTARTVIYVRSTCDDPNSEIVCGNGKGSGASIYLESLAAGTYYVFVDSDTAGSYAGEIDPLEGQNAGCGINAD